MFNNTDRKDGQIEAAEQQVNEAAAATAGARSHLERAIQRQRRSAARVLDAVLRTITRVSIMC